MSQINGRAQETKSKKQKKNKINWVSVKLKTWALGHLGGSAG